MELRVPMSRERAVRLHVLLPRTLEASFWARQHQLDELLAHQLQTLEEQRVRAEFQYNMHIRSLRRVHDELRADRRESPPFRSSRRVAQSPKWASLAVSSHSLVRQCAGVVCGTIWASGSGLKAGVRGVRGGLWGAKPGAGIGARDAERTRTRAVAFESRLRALASAKRPQTFALPANGGARQQPSRSPAFHSAVGSARLFGSSGIECAHCLCIQLQTKISNRLCDK